MEIAQRECASNWRPVLGCRTTAWLLVEDNLVRRQHAILQGVCFLVWAVRTASRTLIDPRSSFRRPARYNGSLLVCDIPRREHGRHFSTRNVLQEQRRER